MLSVVDFYVSLSITIVWHCMCWLLMVQTPMQPFWSLNSLNFFTNFLFLSLLYIFSTNSLTLLFFWFGWFSIPPRLFHIRENFSLLCPLSEYHLFSIFLYIIFSDPLKTDISYFSQALVHLQKTQTPYKNILIWQNNFFWQHLLVACREW